MYDSELVNVQERIWGISGAHCEEIEFERLSSKQEKGVCSGISVMEIHSV